MKARHFLFVSFLAVAAVFTGCRTSIQDLTPSRLQANPSGIYTFRMKADFQQTNIVSGSVRPQIVINGETFNMRQSRDLGSKVWEYDYRVPEGQREVRYYYVVPYRYTQEGREFSSVRYSTEFNENIPHEARLINRYVIQLETHRGPVGARVALVGRGFSEFDRVVMNGQELNTRFESSNAISFTVPAVPAGETYQIFIRTGEGDLPAGEFHVDAARISVQPSRIDLTSGEPQSFTFRIDNPAPSGGLYVVVETDVPDSVIMPEVTIPEGQRSVSAPIEGGTPGSGTLYISAEGFEETRVPVSVR